MMSTVQLKAVLIIMMLAGHEAKRIHDAAATMALYEATEKVRKTPEEKYRELNFQCEWSTPAWGCQGDGCAKRSLALDWPPPLSSQSCRHTDEWMMQNKGVENFKTVVGVLQAKSVKYAEDCVGASPLNRKCARRQQQMMRAMKFISKAEANKQLMDSMTPADKEEQKGRFESALDNVAGTMGEDGMLILQYTQELKKDSQFVKDPKGAVQSLVQTLVKLMDGSDDEKEAARTEMKNFKAEPPLSDEEKEEAAAKNAKLSQQLSEASEADELAATLDSVDDIVPDNIGDADPNTNSSSTLQVYSGNNLVHKGWAAAGIATVLIVMLVVAAVIWIVVEIIAAIVTWALLSLLGCGLYAVGHDAAISEVQNTNGTAVKTMGFFGFSKCFVKAFTYPFFMIGTAAVATYNFFRGDKKNKTEEHAEKSHKRSKH